MLEAPCRERGKAPGRRDQADCPRQRMRSGSAGTGSERDIRCHLWMTDYAKPVSEIIPERDAKLGAGMHQAKKRVAAITAGIAAGPAADLALDDVGVQRNLRPVEHHQQLGFIG